MNLHTAVDVLVAELTKVREELRREQQEQRGVEAELAKVRADLERHLDIASSVATENEALRTKLAEAQQAVDYLPLLTERMLAAEAELSTAQAALGKARKGAAVVARSLRIALGFKDRDMLDTAVRLSCDELDRLAAIDQAREGKEEDHG